MNLPVFHLPRLALHITQQLVGIMLFPDSAADRQRLDRAFQFEFAAPLIKSGAAKISNPVAYDRYQDIYTPSCDQIGQFAKNLGQDPSLVGAILLLTLGTRPELASINLSISSLENAYKNKQKGTSRRTLETLWPRFRTVAHFWAAYQVWMDKTIKRDFEILDGFPCQGQLDWRGNSHPWGW